MQPKAGGRRVLSRNRQWKPVKALISFLMVTVLVWGISGCGDRIETLPGSDSDRTSLLKGAGQLSEVSPPLAIQELSQSLDAYQPQVTIISPSPDAVLQDTTVPVQLQVQDLPIFQDPNLELGPHLEVLLDNQPYTAVYDLEQPLVLKDLAPGTHTLQVFAVRPWYESFKNDGAFAQTTFHIFTKTANNSPDLNLPLLTYNSPTGSYGAEPILLDFYLTNAPLHLVAQTSSEDELADWRIRVTVNGESFVLDSWQPVYLKGFKSGENWVQIEFLDDQGNPVNNTFNNTVRLVDYKPKGKDPLARLLRGELSTADARGIVEPNYQGKVIPTVPTVEPSPTPIPIPTEEEIPPLTEPTTPLEETPQTEPQKVDKKPSGGLFNRFRRPAVEPSPEPELPEVLEAPSPEFTVVPEPTPQLEETPEPENSVIPSELPTSPEEQITPEIEPTPASPEKPQSDGFFNRFRRPSVAPSLEQQPTLPEIMETPLPEQIEPSIAPVEPNPTEEAIPSEPISPKTPQSDGFFNRFRRPPAAPSLEQQPTLPEIMETPLPEQVEPAETDTPVISEPEIETAPQENETVTTPTDATESISPDLSPAPKLDIKELLLPSSAPVQKLPIIQAPEQPNIPARYRKNSTPIESEATESTEEEVAP